MGANNFEHFVEGTNLAASFETLVAQSRYESGHSYSGEIGMKSGFRIRSNELMLLSEAHAFAQSDVRNNDKWDDQAFAVKVKNAEGQHIGFLLYGYAPS